MNLEKMIPERYRVTYDEKSGVFRILDLWAEDIKNLPLDAEVPDTSPAMKILSTLEINAIIGKLIKLGWLDRIINSKEVSDIKDVAHEIVEKKDVKEVAIESIVKVLECRSEDAVAHEAILAIREIVNK